MSEPYRIEVDEERCQHCLRGATWNVIGPDGIALGVSYMEEDDAQDMATMLTNAHNLALELAAKTRPEIGAIQRDTSMCPCIDPDNCNEIRCGGEELHGYRCQKAASKVTARFKCAHKRPTMEEAMRLCEAFLYSLYPDSNELQIIRAALSGCPHNDGFCDSAGRCLDQQETTLGVGASQRICASCIGAGCNACDGSGFEKSQPWATIIEAARLLGRTCEDTLPGSDRAYFALLDIVRQHNPHLILNPPTDGQHVDPFHIAPSQGRCYGCGATGPNHLPGCTRPNPPLERDAVRCGDPKCEALGKCQGHVSGTSLGTPRSPASSSRWWRRLAPVPTQERAPE